jgi:hypothetical protein
MRKRNRVFSEQLDELADTVTGLVLEADELVVRASPG